MTTDRDARTAELAAGLIAVRARVSEACVAAGRTPDDVTIIVVTKTYPVDDAVALTALGVHDLGENRDQEAAAKQRDWAERVAVEASGSRWHMIGQLQTNKARSVVQWADVVHSVDRPGLINALNDAMRRSERAEPLDVLLQVGLDNGAGRGGAAPDAVAQLAEAVAESEHLRLRGVMAVAPLGGSAREAFARLAEVAASVRVDHPGATWISAGMSGDLEDAIQAGATHVRVGSAVLGERAPVR
jgi:pyridoxal phosphate enzyme (YggS family)